jgi:hypothetical protein
MARADEEAERREHEDERSKMVARTIAGGA